MGGCGCSDERTRWISGQPLIKFGTMNTSGQVTFDGDTVAVPVTQALGTVNSSDGQRAIVIEHRPGQWTLLRTAEE